MTRKRYKVRVSGLVSLMNSVRDQLRIGIPEGEVETFRAAVRRAIKTVDRICRESHATPEDLPTPSRRAYEYLRNLDLDDLPVTSEPPPPEEPPLSITGVIASCNRYHQRFRDLIAQVKKGNLGQSPEVERLATEIRTEADAIADLFESAGGKLFELPTPSRRGYQWMRFLSDADNLSRHLDTLATLTRAGQRIKSSRPQTARIRIYATSMLFRTRPQKRVMDILVNEGFIDAPDHTLTALMREAFRIGSDVDRDALKRYAASPDYAEVQMALVSATPTDISATAQGVCHDLQEAFDRVNETYFEGEQSLPRLAWSEVHTYRKFGHYDSTRDVLMISTTLDAYDVPEYVVDFAVYHELLHRELGVRRVNGRRRIHTPKFREREREFQHYDEAQAVLTRLSSAAP
ncbi:MAG: hypothetical protein ACP5JG_03860 [Anaerolineae bacterium]